MADLLPLPPGEGRGEGGQKSQGWFLWAAKWLRSWMGSYLWLPSPRPSPGGRGRRIVLLLITGALLPASAWTLDRLFPPDLSRLDAVGTEVLDRNGRLVALLPAPGGVWRFRTSTADVSRPFLDLLVHTEDRRFWSHPGVDPLALVRALSLIHI